MPVVMVAVRSLFFPARIALALRTPVVQLHLTAKTMGGSVEDFNQAKDQLGSLKKDPGNEVKLKIYALFKQATQGPCNLPKPSMLDFVNKAKWDAWKSLGSVSQEEARQKYVELVASLVAAEKSVQATLTSDGSSARFETVLFNTEDNITTIRLNRPEKKNAITITMYNEIVKALELAAKEDSVITVITGSGDYYCSGNDLNNFTQIPEGGKEKVAKTSGELLKGFVQAFIDFPKPIIAVVNGPAVGISVTVLGLCDVVYATERATFHTPFSQLGQSPEGCSSYTFPKMMGAAKGIGFINKNEQHGRVSAAAFGRANEMLLFNRKLTATEACARGLVTEVFPDSTFHTEVWTRLKMYAKLPKNSLALSKQLVRNVERERLYAVNAQEVACLEERWLSDECMNAIISFFQAKAKL